MKKNFNYTDINQKRNIVINAWDKEKVNSLDEISSFRMSGLFKSPLSCSTHFFSDF